MQAMPMRVSDELLAFAKEHPEKTVTIGLADFLELVLSAECDETLTWCEVCGAWIALDDEARCSAEDVSGCWKAFSDRPRDQALCRSHRAIVIEEAELMLRAARS